MKSVFPAKISTRYSITIASRILISIADVVVIGGKNSAAEAALDLWRHGARVTLVHRGAQMHNHVKYWVRPGHREPHQGGRDHRALQQHRAGDQR
jgi:cation diffusion facilitator CzcD-associated flavoprotein CzcO